jgi:Iron-containing redox enzyme
MSNNKNLVDLINEISTSEEKILKDLLVEENLSRIISSQENLKVMAESFYFVRHSFCHLNFIVGERCGNNEFLWSGLAKNLYEELGGKSGTSHNQLYINFLASINAKSEKSLKEPEFARQFNYDLEMFCRQAPLEEVISAIAIYEIFDIPDYQLLLKVMKKANVPQQGLRFFQIHAVANHFEMFEDIICWLKYQKGGEEAFNRAKKFIFHTQTKMWHGLIEHLESSFDANP